MGKIFYLMGKSSSGKDTVFKQLLENRSLKLKTIVPYTTRPIRAGETNGVEYYFTDEETFGKIRASGRLIEFREYHTFHGIWKYFTVNDEQINLPENDYLIIGTIESYNKMKAFFGRENVIPVLIELDDGCRLQRALDREKAQDFPKYEEMCRRFLADAADFSEENINHAGITKRFCNDALTECIKEITAYILKFRSSAVSQDESCKMQGYKNGH